MKRISNKYLPALLFVLSGLLAGAALPELMHMGDGSYAGFASLYAVQKFETSQIQYMDVFMYVLSVRIITLLFLWMSCFTPAGKLFHLLYFWWLAASGGMLLALFALKKGGQGLILFGCSLLPQWILYAAMWKRELGFLIGSQELMNSSEGLHQKIYQKEKKETQFAEVQYASDEASQQEGRDIAEAESGSGSEVPAMEGGIPIMKQDTVSTYGEVYELQRINRSMRHRKKDFWQNFASMFFMCITGSACESFLGIRLLKIFLEIFM